MKPDLEKRIHEILMGSRAPIKATQIAEQIGSTRKEVNRCLYYSEALKNTIEVDDSGFWKIVNANPKKNIPIEQIITAEAYFSPAHKCFDKICDEIQKAKKTIRIQAYTFLSQKIARALIQKKTELGNHIEISIIVYQVGRPWSKRSVHDREFELNDVLSDLRDGEVDIFVEKEKFNHNKVLIVDGEVVITGSMNFNEGSDTNRENIVIVRNKKFAEEFEKNWQEARLASGAFTLVKKIKVQ